MKSKKKTLPPIGEFKPSYLVQRLCQPYRGKAKEGSLLASFAKDNPFAFGGGLRNGGLSGEAMDLIREVFEFDYMGAAEYEFGAVPEGLQKVARFAEHGLLQPSIFQVDIDTVPNPDYRKTVEVTGDPSIYLLCPLEWQPLAMEQIRAWAKGKGPNVKEGVMLDWVLRPSADYPSRVAGWLDITNGIMFFTDEEMWRKCCDLFGVGTEVE